MGYSFRLTARVLSYAPSHRQDSTYHNLIGYMKSDKWLKDTNIAREDTSCHHYIGYFFRLAARNLLQDHPINKITHTTTHVTPAVEHWLEQEIAQLVHHEGVIKRPTHHKLTLPQSYIQPPPPCHEGVMVILSRLLRQCGKSMRCHKPFIISCSYELVSEEAVSGIQLSCN